jgi:hypothetical protein
MTADGSEVFFTSSEHLTSDDHDSSTDLFAWHESSDSITRLSAGAPAGDTNSCNSAWTEVCNVEAVSTTGGGARLSGATDNNVAATAGDIYFYSPEQLTPGQGIPGRRNLYVSHEGSLQYVATLDSDKPITRIQVSKDGEHAAFVTASQLTPYNNNGFAEMYTYDRTSGTLTCVSCKPDGTPPAHDVKASQDGLFMSEDGRAFFYTKDALVPADSNGLNDVYEFVNGSPRLISSGIDNVDKSVFGEAGLVGVSANGIDVYFASFQPLVEEDKNGGFLRFYDARSGGGFPHSPRVAPCAAADECHGEGSRAVTLPKIGSTAELGQRGNSVKTQASKRHCSGKARRGRKHCGRRRHKGGHRRAGR